MRHRTIFAFAALGACAAGASAQPTDIEAAFVLQTLPASVFPPNDELSIVTAQTVAPGASTTLAALNPAFGADILFSSTVETVGLQRTVTISYMTSGDPFLTQTVVDLLIPPGAGGDYLLLFGTEFDDPQWDGSDPMREWRLIGDGALIIETMPTTNTLTSLTPNFAGFADESSPAQPGFFGASVVADRFEFEITYTIVPAAPAWGAGMVLLLGARRRRR
ncbi:MAG: hypothetical protein Tsb0013_04470 [Phycisphaerales bacterium]